MTSANIKSAIYARADEIIPASTSYDPFESYMTTILDECYRQILNECPLHLLPFTEYTTPTIVMDTTNSIAYVKKPTGFIRLGHFYFTDWTNPARKFITPEHPDYKMIENGVKVGGKVKPVVVMLDAMLGSDTKPEKYLACYQVTSSTSAKLYYVKYDATPATGIELIDDTVITNGLAWLGAAKLLKIANEKAWELAEQAYMTFIATNTK
ncbi:hypothetical protein [Lentimicrobium sp.]|uniref:hypothetical protein n=1 Tax=Lentimicrobium sp. TaxID=2034841 RepID=UPI00345E6A75